MLPDYLPARVSSLPATHRRSSPRALCLLQPELRPRAQAWAEIAAARAAHGEHTAGPDCGHRRESPAAAPALALTAPTRALVQWLAQRRPGPRGLCFRLDALTLEDLAPRLDPGLEIPLAEQRWLIDLWSRGERLTHFQRLGLAPTGDPAAIRRAYLATCRRLHPDRYYGKHIGRFAGLLVDLFHRARAAQVYLGDPRRCARYLAQLIAAGHPVVDTHLPAAPSPTPPR